jgi:UDP-glucose 4-epimerase
VRVLISGASGLIGGRLIRHFLESGGVQIRAASRIVRAWPNGVEGCVAATTEPASLHEACKGIDAVINLSSQPDRLCSVDPQNALRVNGGGSLALVSAAARNRVFRFVQVSTCKVYGDDPRGPVTEDTACKPQSHYAITHRLAEEYVTFIHPSSVVLRLANGFGAPVEASASCWDLLVNQMCRQAAVDRRIVLRSSGVAWRNFVPMDDIVKALHAAATDLPAGTYNLGSSHSMELRRLAARIAEVCSDTLGSAPAIEAEATGDPEWRVPLDYRVDKLAGAGFTSTAPLEAELKRLLLMASRSLGCGQGANERVTLKHASQ